MHDFSAHALPEPTGDEPEGGPQVYQPAGPPPPPPPDLRPSPQESDPAASSPEGEPQKSHIRCKGRKKDGTQCGAWAIKELGLCAGHAGLGAMRDPAAYGRKGSGVSGAVRSDTAEHAKKRAIDVYRAAVELHAAAFVAIRLAIASSDSVQPSDRLRAMEQLEARALGRPTETVETVTRPASTVEDLRNVSDAELAELHDKLRLIQGGGASG